MKCALLLLLTTFMELCLANDTLTRDQVYNFSVGDTFDYEIVVWNNYYPYLDDTTSFRQVITDVYYSADSDTLFVVRRNFGSVISFAFNPEVPNALDFFSELLALTNLEDYEIYYRNYGLRCDTGTIYILNNTFNGRTTNGTFCSLIPHLQRHQDLFSDGLGIVKLLQWTGTPEYFDKKTIELKYYSKGNETWGNRLNVGIEEPRKIYVSIYPIANSGTFYLSIDYLKTKMEFQIIDIYGRIVFKTEPKNRLSIVSIGGLTIGLYTWRLTDQTKILQTGKLILSK